MVVCPFLTQMKIMVFLSNELKTNKGANNNYTNSNKSNKKWSTKKIIESKYFSKQNIFLGV